MNDSQEMLVVCMALIGGTVVLSLLLACFAPCITSRGRVIGILIFVILGLCVTSSALNFYRLVPLPVFIYLNLTMFAYWGSFVRPATRPLLFRIFVSWPCSIYQGSCMLLLIFSWVTIHFWRWLPLVFVGLCAIGFLQSTLLWKEYVYFSLKGNLGDSSLLSPNKDASPVREPFRVVHTQLSDGDNKRTLKIAQITDPHLGTFMSAERLHEICTTIANWNPDLVFLTGDFTTVESYFEPEKLAYGFSPLKALPGKLYACLGNHDYESLETVEEALKETGVVLLKDEQALVETPIGTIQIIGTEFTFSRKAAGQRKHILEVCDKFPNKDYPRICLVHNPEEFTHFPDGTADLVFSGHTHGGQLGLFSLGLNITMYRIFKRSPDNGLWRKGNNLLYVHRGTGFYGFPLRLGVSGELSLLNVTM